MLANKMWTPTHVIVTGNVQIRSALHLSSPIISLSIFLFLSFSSFAMLVLRARNLLEKGKGGNDAYCMIGMGKEKFLTSVKPKTNVPAWNEQAELYV